MSARVRRAVRPQVESLENRCVPATFTVTNLKDNLLADPLIKGSLRWAVDKANANTNLDTIVFKPGMEGAILLTSGQLEITSNLVLAGPGSGKITIDGNAAGSIFNINDGDPGAFKNVTIRGLTLFNALTASAGGAIFSRENLTLVKTVITGNQAFAGGGVFSYGARLTIRGCTIQDNEATDSGGGVYAGEGVVLADASQIGGNRSGMDGGGIFVTTNAALTIRKTTLAGNAAGQDGGGIFATSSPALTVRKSTLAGNTAGRDGGGLRTTISVTYLTIENSILTGNRAASRNGGALLTQATLSTVKKTIITFNKAEKSGGGLASNGAMEIDRCTINGNTAVDSGSGGGIWQLNGGALTLTNSTVSGNHADAYGGGIYHNSSLLLTIRGCTIVSNHCVMDGGGLLSGNETVISGSNISGNTADTGNGGGIWQGDYSLMLTSSTVSGNHADQGFGGGIHIEGTTAASTLTGCTIAANSSTGGGGMWIENSFGVTLQNSTISGNRASDNGGGLGVYMQPEDVILQGCTIAFNRAGTDGTGYGGGIVEGSSVTVLLQSTLVANNLAPDGGPDVFGSFDATASLVRDPTDGILTGSYLSGFDPLLAPLAFNGGPTQTHALMKGSPAIDAGSNPALLPFDQRGKPFKRKLGPAVDIGAFERQ